MSWWDLLPEVCVALALLFVPGMIVIAAAAPLSLRTVGLGPVVSVGVVSVSAVAAGLVGIGWSLWVPFAAAAVVALPFGLLRFFARRRQAAYTATRRPAGWWAAGLGLVVAAVLIARRFVFVVGSPENFSQTFDNVFHLNAIRYVLETGSGSSLDLGGITSIAFYPGAWHDVVSLVAATTGASVPAAISATNLVVATLVWPAGCIYLVSVLFPGRVWTLPVAGVLSTAFGSFPLLLINFGVLYPNFLAVALLPALLGATAALLGLPDGAEPGGVLRFVRDALLVLVGLAGVALSHPNGAMSWLALSIPLLAWCGWRYLRAAWDGGVGSRRRSIAVVAAAGLGVVLVSGVLWRYVRPPYEASQWPPPQTQAQAIGESLSGAHLDRPVSWLVAALIVAGLVTAVRDPRRLWLCGPFFVSAFLFVVISGTPYSPFRYWATGVWYNDSNRVAAIMPIGSLVVAVLGAVGIVGAVSFLAGRAGDALALGATARRTVVVVLAVLGSLLLLWGSQGENVREVARQGADRYQQTADSPLVDEDEAALLGRLDEVTPPDAVIAGNPWTGAALAYALADREVTEKHILTQVPDDVLVLDADLADIDDDPAVCAAVVTSGVTHVLDFGDRFVNDGRNMSIDYSGLEHLREGEHLRLVDSEGDARLFEIVGCSR